MLETLNERAIDTLDQALAAEQRAREATDPQLQLFYERQARRWRVLARRLEFAESVERFLFRCPIIGIGVQGFLVEEIPGDNPNPYEPVTCLSCGRVHLVNFKTRTTVGERSARRGSLPRIEAGQAQLHELASAR